MPAYKQAARPAEANIKVARVDPLLRIGAPGGGARRRCYVITSEIRDPCVSRKESSEPSQKENHLGKRSCKTFVSHYYGQHGERRTVLLGDFGMDYYVS